MGPHRRSWHMWAWKSIGIMAFGPLSEIYINGKGRNSTLTKVNQPYCSFIQGLLSKNVVLQACYYCFCYHRHGRLCLCLWHWPSSMLYVLPSFLLSMLVTNTCFDFQANSAGQRLPRQLPSLPPSFSAQFSLALSSASFALLSPFLALPGIWPLPLQLVPYIDDWLFLFCIVARQLLFAAQTTHSVSCPMLAFCMCTKPSWNYRRARCC